MTRRVFLRGMAGTLVSACGISCATKDLSRSASRPNFLLITADDLNYDSLGVTGSTTPNITPNIDRLASEGIRFVNAHVTVAVCQPSRSVLMTGRYPHRNGAVGFNPIFQTTPTLQESLNAAGYLNGIISKTEHHQPAGKFCWDMMVEWDKVGWGRVPSLYYDHVKAFLDQAKRTGKPFCLMANINDPHRPFPRTDEERWYEQTYGMKFPPVDHQYRPEEVQTPGFLPDLPVVRDEVAQYYAAVRRCDQSVGEILRALKESGLENDTLVMFLSDNGMAFPMAKLTCYLAGTHTPWICRWPGRIREGSVDQEHFISGIDLMPTVLDALRLDPVPDVDGRSFLPILLGRRQHGRERVFTSFHGTNSKAVYPTRCVQDRQFGYIYNAWADGKTAFPGQGLSMVAMRQAAQTDPEMAQRIEFLMHRVPEELYDLEHDPHALQNLSDLPQHRERRAQYRQLLLEHMTQTADPLTSTFRDYLAAREEVHAGLEK